MGTIAWWEVPLLIVAGFGGGLCGSIAGLASLVTYPALLAVGLAPVTANVSNTVALVFNSVGSVSASRQELDAQSSRLRRYGAAGLLGGAVGAVLLLSTPSHSFERIVPWLIGFGSLSVLINRRGGAETDGPHPADSRLVLGSVFLIAVYGGYFGAAAGVLLLALLLIVTPGSLPRCNAMKNLVLGLANGVAAVAFVIFGTVSWTAAIPMAVGLFAGGRLGPAVVRRSPARLLRAVIALAGIGLAVYLGISAYR